MNDIELYHSGVKGMKWGVRRSLNQLGATIKRHNAKASANRSARAAVEAAKPKPKSVSEMSDAELRSKLDRINMERQYKQYLAELNPKRESMLKRVALKFLENGLTTVGNKVVSNVADKYLTKPDTPISLTKRDVTKIGPKEAAALATYAKNLKKIEAYMNGEAVGD